MSDCAEAVTCHGHCLCGAVRFRAQTGALRHRSGAADDGQLSRLALPEAERFGVNFCPTCGSPVPHGSPKIGRVNVPAGSLDGDPGIKPAFHIYVGSRAPWFDITDRLPTHDEAAPGR